MTAPVVVIPKTDLPSPAPAGGEGQRAADTHNAGATPPATHTEDGGHVGGANQRLHAPTPPVRSGRGRVDTHVTNVRPDHTATTGAIESLLPNMGVPPSRLTGEDHPGRAPQSGNVLPGPSSQPCGGHLPVDTQDPRAVAPPTAGSQNESATHGWFAPAAGHTATDQGQYDAHLRSVGVPAGAERQDWGDSQRNVASAPATMKRPASLLWVYASAFESAQRLRLAQMNRLRSWVRADTPEAEWAAKGLDDKALNDRALYDRLPNDQRGFVNHLVSAEADMLKVLDRELKRQPLWPFLKGVRGVGPALGGCLLARTEPLTRYPSPAHLWSYCGLDGPEWKRRTPEGKYTFSPKLNRLTWLISGQIQRTPAGASPYRILYDGRKEYESFKPWCGACHPKQCTAPHDVCTPGHINAKARRYAVKRLLADLWDAAQQVAQQAGES